MIVIPFEWVSLPAQLRKVEYEGNPGKIDDGVLGNLWTAPEIKQPDLPYLLVDVDTGVSFLEYEDSLTYIKRMGRSPLNVTEGVSLVLHYPQILATHALVLLGTRCHPSPPVSLPTCSPHLRLDNSDDRPILSCDPLEIERFEEAGAASCFRRVFPLGYWYGRD